MCQEGSQDTPGQVLESTLDTQVHADPEARIQGGQVDWQLEEHERMLLLEAVKFCCGVEGEVHAITKQAQKKPKHPEEHKEEQERIRESWNCHQYANHFASNCSVSKMS